MPVPDYETMMLPVLRLFAEGATRVSDCLQPLATLYGLSADEVAELLPSGKKTKLADRAHWARTYLSKAGLLESPRRNVHVITSAGRQLLASNPPTIDNALLNGFDGFAAWKSVSRTGDSATATNVRPVVSATPESQTPDEIIAGAYEEIVSALTADLLAAIQTMTPKQFEQLIVDLLLAMGYGGGDRAMGERIGKSGDGGIDGIINEDALGLDAVYIQAKRYAPDSKVGRPALQAFVGSLTGEGANKGVFVTTSDFSKDAKDYLNKVQQRIVLINGETLARLMIRHEVGVRARKTYVVRSVDEDYFSEAEGG
jgi:restriction system protein